MSCGCFGTASAIEHLLCVQAANGANEDYRDLVQEVIYGGSRVEIGGGKIRGDGSIGAWAAKFVSQYGVVPRGTHGTRNLSAYSESLCREFGRSGVPDDLEAIAKQHPVRSVALVRSWSECQAAIRNGYPIAVCSNQGFAMTRDRDGFCAPRGTWYHCMAIVGIRGGARPGAFVLNSWGANAHTGPLGLGDPSPAGFWADATVVDRMLRQGDSWAFSDAVGFPARKLNWYAARPDLRFKARAALALTFAEATRSYADAHAEAERTRQPLVVFVGQPERTVTGAITVGVDGFPDARSPSVVLGIPGDGRFRRLDLPGRPEERAIRNAMTLPSSTSLPRDCGICKLR